MSDQELIWASLEDAADRCDDLSPLIYETFLRQFPRAGEIFGVNPFLADYIGAKWGPCPSKRADTMPFPLEMGGMANEILRLIADGGDQRQLTAEMATVALTHDSMKIDPEMYAALIQAIPEAVQKTIGAGWTDDIAAAWRRRCDMLVTAIGHSLAA